MTTPRCSVLSTHVGEPLAGTAPEARGWLVLEQSGPWGRQALTESHLDAGVGAALQQHAAGTGVNLLLVRHPGRHADDHHTPHHRLAWLASTLPGRSWLRRIDVHDPRELLALDLHAAARGEEPEVGVRDDEPLLLVCTNSRRDRCCAIDGRPAAAQASARYPERVWECNHLGGHRFAPTALLLPSGLVHGRFDGTAASRLLDDAIAGDVGLDTLRGRSTWPPAAQAAEIDVRRELGLTRVDAVTSAAVETIHPDGSADVVVVLADGSVHRRLVEPTVHDAVLRPESCVKPAVPLTSLSVVRPGVTR